jgi:hypothetical protein
LKAPAALVVRIRRAANIVVVVSDTRHRVRVPVASER